MSLAEFDQLPDDSTLWIYGFEDPLSNEQERLVRTRLNHFLSEWATHGQPVRGAFCLVERQFVLLAGFASGGISGCSIDASVRVFKELRDEANLDGLDRSRIYFRDREGNVQSCHFNDFRSAVEDSEIEVDGRVFDTQISTLGALRREGFEKAYRESWHAGAFGMPVNT